VARNLTHWLINDDGHFRSDIVGPALDRFLYQMGRVLEEVGPDKLRKCPACDRLFVKVTKKRFCSQRCQSRTYMRGYRKGRYDK